MAPIKLNIQAIATAELEETAHCHMSAFPSSFSTKLGISYVIKMLEWYIVSKDRFLLSITIENKIVGYVGGAKGSGSTSGMLQYAYWKGFTAIITRPYLFFSYSFLSNISLISKNIRKRIFQRGNKVIFSEMKIPQGSMDLSVGLILIGVDPNHRREGVGSALIKAFIDNAKRLGGSHGHLSVKTSNINAISAYKKNGWDEVLSHDKESTSMAIILR